MSETANYLVGDEPIELNAGRRTCSLTVENTGDRAIQVGSHFHFLEVNRALRFDRAASYGMRLNIPAGTAVRFEPGDSQAVELVELGGTRQVEGLNGLTRGRLDDPGQKERVLSEVVRGGFADTTSEGGC
ncbi:MAG: urease subunit beta [Chloroflexota bacterium]